MAEARAWVMIPKLNQKGTECIIDMRPLVLCKECKHYDPDTQSCNNGLDGIFTPLWFCADGQRRNANNE